MCEKDNQIRPLDQAEVEPARQTLEPTQPTAIILAEEKEAKPGRDKKGRFISGNTHGFKAGQHAYPETEFKPGQHAHPENEFKPGQHAYPKTEFKPGQSGNPSGLSKTQRESLEAIRLLTPRAAETLQELLENPDTPPAVRLRACEVVFDRVFGKAVAPVKVTSVTQSVEEAQTYLLALVERVRSRMR